MNNEDIEGIADAINEFVHDSVEPLSTGLSDVVKRVDEIHARPIPENGKDGVDGKDGADGQDGAKGDTGEKGVDGVGFDAPAYESGVYREGSIVQAHFGQVYKAVRDTSEGVDSDDWARVGTAGFRLTGTYEAEREYVAGDLFIKGFGLFLHDGAEARLIAGRGPEGKKGEKGATGKDGKDGQNGKDGATFDALEIKGTSLVAVIRSEEGLQEHAVDLAPFLEATVEVTKSVSEAHTDEAMKALDNQFKSLWETFQQHLTDQQATPVRFFRGGYTPSVTYQAGDLVNFSQSLYVAKQASTGILPHGQLAKDVKSGDYWAMLTFGGGGGVGDGEGVLPVLPTYALVTESGSGGTKFRSFSQANGTDPIVGVGLQNGQNVKFDLTTDAVAVNPNTFRNAKGQFIGTPEELEALKNQRDVNEFLYNAISDIEAGDVNLDGYATETYVDEAILNIDFPDPNLDGYATEVWVTEQIDAIPETDLSDCVSKIGGDDMDGPLTITKPQEVALEIIGDGGKSQVKFWSSGAVALQNYNAFKDNELVHKKYVDDSIDAIEFTDVEDRLDDIESALPSDSAQPVDIGPQTLKITGSRPTGSGGEAGKMLCWKAAAGTGGSPYNEIKFVVPDTSVIDLTATQLWLVQSGAVQKWMAIGGWFTNGNVLHISGPSTEGDDLIDGQPVEMYYSDPHAEFLETISREESKADDRRLQAEIEQVALGLETLLTQRTHGQWKYIGFSGDNIPRNEGEFSLASDDLSAQDNIITINLTDLNGMTIGLSDVGVGDYVEIVDLDEPANYVLFTCTKAPEGTGISNIEVALKDKGNNFLIGDACEIRFFSINQENIDLSELDARYLKLSGGTMNAGKAIFVDQIEPVDNTRYIRYEAGRDKRYPFALANCGMVQDVAEEIFDEKIQNDPYLPLTGGTLTGALEAPELKTKAIQEGDDNRIKLESKVIITKAGDSDAEGFTIKGKTDQGNNGDLFSAYHNSSGFDAINYRGKQDAPKNIATVGYVDSKVDGATVIPTVGRRFTFGWSSTPSAGYFSFNGQQVIFAFADMNGVIRKHTSEDFTWDNFARMTIWNMEGELCYAAELSKSTDYSSTVMRFYRESVKLDRVLEAGKDYDITIEGYW